MGLNCVLGKWPGLATKHPSHRLFLCEMSFSTSLSKNIPPNWRANLQQLQSTVSVQQESSCDTGWLCLMGRKQAKQPQPVKYFTRERNISL